MAIWRTAILEYGAFLSHIEYGKLLITMPDLIHQAKLD
jgi:hypothetical protein